MSLIRLLWWSGARKTVPLLMIFYCVNREAVRVRNPLILKPNPHARLDDIIVEAFPVREEGRRVEENEERPGSVIFSFYEGCCRNCTCRGQHRVTCSLSCWLRRAEHCALVNRSKTAMFALRLQSQPVLLTFKFMFCFSSFFLISLTLGCLMEV
jgi:hypothetical protein